MMCAVVYQGKRNEITDVKIDLDRAKIYYRGPGLEFEQDISSQVKSEKWMAEGEIVV